MLFKNYIYECNKLLVLLKNGDITLKEAFNILETLCPNTSSKRENYIIQEVKKEFKNTLKAYKKLIEIEKNHINA